MKLKNILISFAVILSSLFMVNTVKADGAPASLTFNGNNSVRLYGANYLGNGSTINIAFKQATNGKIVYCTEIHDNWFYSGTKTYYKGSQLAAKYAYVMENGYPNKSITGNKYKDYYITSLATWYLVAPNDSTFSNINLNAGTYKGVPSTVIKEVAKLVNGALNYSYVEPTLKLNAGNVSFTLSGDGNYYISNGITMKSTGDVSSVYVTLSNAPDGSFVADYSGSSRNYYGPAETFYVKVPVSGIKSLSNNFNLNASATVKVNKAYAYNPTVSSYQSVTALYPEEKNLWDSVNLNLSLKTKVEITKVDASTGKGLAGATLVVKDANGTVKDTWVSDTSAHVIEDLPVGKYTLTETKAPDGYKLSAEIIDFEVTANSTTVIKVEMKNYPNKFVYISKQDATTGEELPGATLVLKNEKGKVIDEWVSESTPHEIKNLSAGKYTLTETIAPEGYKLSTETVTFTVEKDGTVKEPVVMLNYPKEPETIYISKQDATTGEELPGAYLEIRNEAGEIVEAWISGTTPHKVVGLEAGVYTLTETIAPDGYELSTETITFTVKEDGTVDGMIVMYNKPEVVEVPSTSSFKTITASLIGMIVIGLGAMIIYKNYKKNEKI